MTSRSIVLSTAALLLLSAATPVQFGFSPTAAVAQEVSAEVRAALTGDPAGLEAAQLSDRIRVLREAIESGVLKGEQRKAAQQKVKAYREVLKQLRDERKEARKEKQQADQPAAGQRKQAQGASQQAEQQTRKEERKEEQQARKAERKQEQPAQQQEQAQRPAQQEAQQQRTQRQAQASDTGLSEEMRAALRDTRPASELEAGELRERVQVLRGILQSAPLSQEQRNEVQARMQADREVLRSRRDQEQQQAEPEQAQPQQAQPQQAQPQQAQTRERQSRQSRSEVPEAEVEQRAQEIMSDKRPADDLDDQALRQRLSENRAILETGKLSRAEVRELRQQLRSDREELRSRVAAKQDAAEEDEKPASGASSTSTSTSSTEVTTTTNVNVIIQQQTPPDRLSERDLERRVRALNRALREERLARRDAEIAREIVERDRRELRRRLHADRDRRRDRWRDPRYRDELVIDFNVGYRPPPVIFAAEAMPRDIEMQLIAPPPRQVTRAYSMREITSNQDVREMMPGIEIDTLNFDFGSAEVRPEEIDKLDGIAEVIERIVAARPDEVFLIEGHTDAVGSDAANDALSQRRAQAVAEALLDYYAIDPENLQTVGLGERYLKIWTEEPEEENRRVTIRRITPLLAGGQG